MNLVRGESEVLTDEAIGTAQTSTLTFASINRSKGATIDFVGTNLGVNPENEVVITGSGTSTIATAWAFYSSPTFTGGTNAHSYAPGYSDAATDFAIINSNGTNGSVSAASGTVVTSSSAMTAFTDYTLQGTTTTFSADTSVNTLRQNTANGVLALAGHTLSVNGLMSVTAMTVGSTVGDGFLTASGTAGGELVLDSPSANMTINSVLKDNGAQSPSSNRVIIM